MISFLRPTIFKKPSESTSPRSPVWNQPSVDGLGAWPSRSASSRANTTPPRIISSPSSAIRMLLPGNNFPTEPTLMAPTWLTVMAALVSVRP